MSGMLSIGVTGIRAAQIGLMTTEHNVANANTAGFTRQRITQNPNIALATGSGFIGQGTSVGTVDRIYSSFLTAQVNRAQTSVSELDTYYAQIRQIDNMLADPTAGLSPALQDFFRGAQEVASNPSMLPSRQAMVSSAQALVARFRSIEGRLGEMYEGVNSQIQSTVSTINSYASQIAELNQRIVLSQAASGQPANDLLDQRDQLLNDLNKLVKVQTVTQGDGAYNVFVGTGQQLVVGTQTVTMTADVSVSDPSRVVVGLKTAGAILELPEDLVTGGSLAGFLRFRKESLDGAANELGRVSASLALTFNAQHELGQDLLGNIDGDPRFVDEFFTIPAPKVIPNALNPGGSPTVTASFDAPSFNGNFYTNLTTSDYELRNNAGTLTLTRLSDRQQWTGASVAAINTALAADPQGFTLAATGAVPAGAVYRIEPTREIARNFGINAQVAADPRLIAAAAPVRASAGVANTGDGRISSGIVASGYSTVPLPATLTFNGAGPGYFAEAGALGATVTSSGGGYTVTFSGMTFEITGTPQLGDTFVVERNTGGVGDARNAVLLGKLQIQNTMAGQTATYQSAYSQMVSNNGNRTREAEVTGKAQQALLEQAQAARNATSGVNLDEEAASLLRYQVAYQASAKMVDVAGRLFDVILSIGS